MLRGRGLVMGLRWKAARLPIKVIGTEMIQYPMSESKLLNESY